MQEQTQTLAKFPPRQLERFLVELANLQVDIGAVRRFRERFAAFIPPHDDDWLADLLERHEETAEQVFKLAKANIVPVEEMGENAWVVTLQRILSDLWTEPDTRQKEWGVFAFRYALYKWGDQTLAGNNLFKILYEPEKRFRVPPPTPFEQALSYLVKAGDKARYCANPECPAPYFFVKRKNQRYCSEICAAPAQRELKRKWWAEHGEDWRKARTVKKSVKGKTAKKKTTGKKED